jgi:hypothetical protein
MTSEAKPYGTAPCVHCDKPLTGHASFARCAGGATQYTPPEPEPEPEPERIRCNQCEALMIQGVFCHETGCPNSGSRYYADFDTWIKQRTCRECGCTVDEDDPCCSAPFEDEEEQ